MTLFILSILLNFPRRLPGLGGDKSLAAIAAEKGAQVRAPRDIFYVAFGAATSRFAGHTKCDLVIRGELWRTHLGVDTLEANL